MSERATKVARVMTYALFLAAYGFAALFCVWWFPRIDPMIPNFEAVHSEIPGAEEGFTRPGSFEVKRVFVSDRHAYARVCAYMQRRPKEPDLTRNGRPVVPDTGQYQIACAETALQAGRDVHDRFWQLPLLPAGDYVYVSKFVFCNPLRCHEQWLPEIPVRLK